MYDEDLHRHVRRFLRKHGSAVALALLPVVGYGVVRDGIMPIATQRAAGQAPVSAAPTAQATPRASLETQSLPEGVLVDRREYARQAAVGILLSQRHDIHESHLVFYRDPDRPGSAIDQFADRFGEAIDRTSARETRLADRGQRPD